MGVPSTRTPVRVARGTYANLSTVDALAALQEGEICFATDEGKLYVKQGASLNGISASSQAQPVPGDVTASPAFAGGTGTQADPYVITGGTSPFAGGTLESAQQITIANGTAGDLVLFTDQSVVASGDRFANQDVGTINSAGNYTFKLNYTDTPSTTTNNTTYNGVLQVGNVWFSWTVVQSDLAPLTEATATSISYSGLAVGNTITATAGTATGGTSPYTYAVRWQRSFNGTSGWFDTGATGTTYTIVQADAGYYVRAVATATDSTPGASGGPLTVDLASVATTQINVNSLADITGVALSEDDPTGARYTSKAFSADATMNPEGVPTSSKAIKVKFSGTFVDYPSTDNVTSITDTDPADDAVTSSSVLEINNGEYTQGQTAGRLLSSNNIYSTVYYHDNSSYFTKFPDDNWYISSFRNGSSSTYSYTPSFYNTDSILLPTLPTSRQSYNNLEFEKYYPVSGGTQRNLGQTYNSTGATYQYADFRGWVKDSSGDAKGALLYAYTDRLFYFPYAGNTGSTGIGYEVNNSNSGHPGGSNLDGFAMLLPGWSGIANSINCYYLNNNFIRWFQNLDVLSNGSTWNLTNSNTYTDINTDSFFPWSSVPGLSGSSRAIFATDSDYTSTGKYTAIWNVHNGTSYVGWFTTTIDFGADPTVLANWTTRYTNAQTVSNGVVARGPSYALNYHVRTDGLMAVAYAYNGQLHWFYSGDYGASWSYTLIPTSSSKTNIINRNDDAACPYYYDGHWFFLGRAFEASTGNAWETVYSSNNNGASWQELAITIGSSGSKPRFMYSSSTSTQSSPFLRSPFLGYNGRLYISTQLTNTYSSMSAYYIDYKTDLALAGGTNLSNNVIRPGDVVRQGNTTGKVVNIDTGTNTITVDNVEAGAFSTGSPLQNTISHSGGTAGTVYGVVGGSGAVSDLQTSDPGFVTLGSNPNITITLPATFPTGNTPDVELPAGTTMQVTVQATNSSGSDTLDSNIITPS